MPRRMDYTIAFDAPAEKIYRDFTSREYWQTLMEAYRFLTPQSQITSFSTTERGSNRAKGAYSASIPHGPGSFGGHYFLTETEAGSTLRLASVCKVDLPFVGGALEDLILHHIKQLFRRRGGGTSRLRGSVHR